MSQLNLWTDNRPDHIYAEATSHGLFLWEAAMPQARTLMPSVLPAIASGPLFGPLALAITGTSGPDKLVSGLASDSLSGLAGDDTLIGGGGNDTLNGGRGTDRMEGGTGNDLYLVDSPSDLVIETADGGIDTVQFTAFTYVLPAYVENMTSFAPYGGLMVGNDLGNLMIGTAFADTLVGAGGADRMKGGMGNDLYYVENRTDVVEEAANAGWDTVYTDLAIYVVPANVEAAFGMAEYGERLTGNSLDNFLGGDRGNDTLIGGTGNDGFSGWLGKDTLTGGTGSDYFQFYTRPGASNVDTITDFDPWAEEIDLYRNGTGMFNALPNIGWLDASAFKKIGPGGSAVDYNDRILYNQSTGYLYYDPDGSGSAAMVPFAILANKAAISAANFWVFDL